VNVRPQTLSGWLLGAACASAALLGCSSADVNMGQSRGAGASHSGGNSASAGSQGVSGNGSGADSGSPCGPSPCADHTGDQTFIEAGAPGDAAEIFAGAAPHDPGADAKREPRIIYPSHETMFPINVSHIRHEWSAGRNDLFELRFVGPNTTVTVYTLSLSWTPGEEEWDWIAESNRGEAVELSISGVDRAAPTDSWTSPPITLLFSDAAVEGAIYYWSTSTKGIMRATVAEPLPEKFYTDPAAGDAEQCVACHTLSRDGKRLAVGYNGETLREVSVPGREVIVPIGATVTAPEPMPEPGMMPKPPKGGDMGGMPAAWTTFSPDAKLLLVAANGTLTLIDSDTGEPVGDNSGVVSIPAGTVATHPDWAAVGDRVAIALGSKDGNKSIEGGSIAWLSYDAGEWGEAKVVVPSSGPDDNNFFPVWSPDSKYLAYVHAVGKSQDAVSAELRLLRVADNVIIPLTRVNQRVSNVDGVMGVGNSMPTWAPSTKPGIFWIAFSSLREYATVRPQDEKADQIWIAAVDVTQADPSYAGFWAPFQAIADGNHRAFWTHTSEDTQCRCVDICGDSLDNDCNGTADEVTCSTCQAREICDDGIDNDCDCVVDDCSEEICDDGIDNDGDGNIDDEDPYCRKIK